MAKNSAVTFAMQNARYEQASYREQDRMKGRHKGKLDALHQ
jgi:hypothetical protein